MKFEALRLPNRSRKLAVIFFLCSALLIAGVLSLRFVSSHALKRELGHFAKSSEAWVSAKSVNTADDDRTLRRLCEEGSHAPDSPFDVSDLERNDPKAWKQANLGIKRAERLLPQAKKLVMESLKAMPQSFNLDADQIAQAQKNVQAVDNIIL